MSSNDFDRLGVSLHLGRRAAGPVVPGVFQAIGQVEVAQVNLPVGLLIWVMIIPMLVKVDFGALHQVCASIFAVSA